MKRFPNTGQQHSFVKMSPKACEPLVSAFGGPQFPRASWGPRAPGRSSTHTPSPHPSPRWSSARGPAHQRRRPRQVAAPRMAPAVRARVCAAEAAQRLRSRYEFVAKWSGTKKGRKKNDSIVLGTPFLCHQKKGPAKERHAHEGTLC